MTGDDAVRAALARALRVEPAEIGALRSVAGGDASRAATCECRGRAVFVKWNDLAIAGQFAAEAAGLAAMRRSGTSLRVPEVLAHGDAPDVAFLALERLTPAARGPRFDEQLGRGLAELHRATDARGFGFPVDGTCGATPQANGFLPRWVDFYRERRLLPQLARARARGMDRREARPIEAVIERLGDWLDDGEPSALIHGDLWSGNAMAVEGGVPALFDPAACFAHREAEFGMMRLFGAFSERTYAAYDEAFPLAPGWRERAPLYSLYHLLNHFHLFGGSYGAQAIAVAAPYARATR